MYLNIGGKGEKKTKKNKNPPNIGLCLKSLIKNLKIKKIKNKIQIKYKKSLIISQALIFCCFIKSLLVKMLDTNNTHQITAALLQC